MTDSFKNILIPVDFTVNTTVAIRKALSLCEGSEAVFHLLHVPKINSNNIYRIYHYFAKHKENQSVLEMANKKLAILKEQILHIRGDVKIATWTLFGSSIESSIIRMAQKLETDIIIIGKNSHHSWFPILNTVFPSRIAVKSGITVLTVKPGAMNNVTRIIVVPIGDNFPTNKLAVIRALKNKLPVHIKLVTFLNERDSNVIPASLLNAYRLLRNNATNNVSYEILNGTNKAREVLRYCKKVHADMVIVNPHTETKVGWLNTQMSDLLPANSNTQILAVHPVS